MTRRTALALLSVCSADSLPAASKHPAAAALGFSLYGMKSLPVPEAIRICAGIGYDGVELCLTPGWSEPDSLSSSARKQILDTLKETRLSVLAFMEQLSMLERDMPESAGSARIQKAAELGHALGLHKPVIETVIGGAVGDWETEKLRIAERVSKYAAVSASAGVKLCVKAHAGAAVNTPAKLLWLYRQVKNPALRLTYDFSHFQMSGISLEASLKELLPYTSFIHVKDVSGAADHPDFKLAGDGNIDYVSYFKLLAASGYAGPIVAEVSSQIFRVPGYDPPAAARHSYEALDRGLREAPLARTWKPT
jgi:sugar phosphate isomerase/epimerase